MRTLFTFFTISLLCISELNAQTYSIDAGHSTVQVNVERFGVVDVSGRFKKVEGTITYDKENSSKTTAHATIAVDSYDANNVGGESAVKSKAFLDAETYPEISFKGTKIISKNNSNYLVGDLTIHGVTNSIELPFTIKGPLVDLPTGKQSIAFNASITINRQDYGITFDRKLPNGTSLVSNDIKITLMILAIAE
ncbi:YceI family protein [uncultured Psychroserpens sp.]|uniref:YceI family protein n=1 Tax=uncultured Psychroserpens sp. TaxID=255436 RepID=UPI0026375594|nr:YceI family protein [uncultured Psychroserpens sp.]